MRAPALLPIAFAATLAVAQTATSPTSPNHDVRWNERGGAALRTQVPAGRSVEWCGPLRAADVVDWEFETADAVDFNVHWHEAGVVHYPVKKDGVQLWSGRLVAAADQSYCWMWTNHGATPTALQARMQRAPRAG